MLGAALLVIRAWWARQGLVGAAGIEPATPPV